MNLPWAMRHLNKSGHFAITGNLHLMAKLRNSPLPDASIQGIRPFRTMLRTMASVRPYRAEKRGNIYTLEYSEISGINPARFSTVPQVVKL